MAHPIWRRRSGFNSMGRPGADDSAVPRGRARPSCARVPSGRQAGQGMSGINPTLISAPANTRPRAIPYEPLDTDAQDAMQSRVDDYYSTFVRAVARNRDVKISDVINGFGQGRVVGASQAVKLGMADRVELMQQTLAFRPGGGRDNVTLDAGRCRLMSLDMRARRRFWRPSLVRRSVATRPLARADFALTLPDFARTALPGAVLCATSGAQKWPKTLIKKASSELRCL